MKMRYFIYILLLIIIESRAQSLFKFTYKISCHEDYLNYAEGEEKADLLIQAAAFNMTKLENIHKGIEQLLEARDVSLELNYSDGLIASYEALGDLYLSTENYSEALDYYTKKSEILNAENRDDEFINALLKMADVSVNTKNFDKTMDYSQRALNLSEKTGSSRSVTRSYYFLALAYRGKFDYEKALEYSYKALEEAEEQNDTYFLGHAYNGIGDINEMSGNYEKAFENYKKSAEIFGELNLLSGLTVANFNIGSMHKVFGRYDQALKYMNESLEMAIENKNDFMIKENYLGLYGLHNLLKNFRKANEYYMLLNSFSSKEESSFIPLSKIEIDYEISKKELDKELLSLKIEREKNIRYVYVAILTILLALTHLFFYRKLKQKKINELRLEERRIRAELSSLQSKINPHFLFNAISSISELINFDPGSAKKMLQNISGLLRYTLRTSKNEFVKLEEEILMVKKYLEIEKIRFGKRLEYSIDVPDTLSNMMIPPLLIQPLVENSIKHGLSNRLEGGMVKVSAYEKVPGKVTIIVEDNGISKEGAGKPEGNGIGLSSVKDRLILVYGSDHSFSIDKEEGFKVKIRIPKKS
ncbi:MAG: histidine kinase [Candidatus Delongbacteria bacterium]|nr:histidine kinase [Candidatus Delongbacteria bacterium]